MTENNTNTQNQTAENAQNFQIVKVFLKDVSFETPQGPKVFFEPKQNDLGVNLNIKYNQVAENLYESVLNITLTVHEQTEEKAVIYLLEVQQAGLFNIVGFEEQQLDHLLKALAPTILFPYARETIDSLVIKGGFPPLQLNPINFDALYFQSLNQQSEDAKASND